MDQQDPSSTAPASRVMVRSLNSTSEPNHSLPQPASRFQFRLSTLFLVTLFVGIVLALMTWKPLAGHVFAAVSASAFTIHISLTQWRTTFVRATWNGVIAGAIFFGVPIVGFFGCAMVYDLVRGELHFRPSDVFIVPLLLLVATLASFLAGLTIALTALVSYGALRAILRACKLVFSRHLELLKQRNS